MSNINTTPRLRAVGPQNFNIAPRGLNRLPLVEYATQGEAPAALMDTVKSREQELQ
jgi:hypothetical protein